MWLLCGLSAGWLLVIALVMAIYIAYINHKIYLTIIPENYHTFDDEGIRNFWKRGKEWRSTMRSRAFLISILVFFIGWILIFLISFLR